MPLTLEGMRPRILETLRKHWVKPRFAERPVPVAPERVDAVARAALDTMLTRQFRVGPLPAADVYEQILDRVRRKVRRNQPIYVTCGYAPLKNPNTVPHSRADWAEFFSLCHLVAWHNKVQAVYAPGLQLRIVFDDSTLVMANRADRQRIKSYMTSIGELVRRLGFEKLFLPSFGHSSFAWLFHFGLYQLANWRVRRWERDPAHQEQIERMHQFARRNVYVPAEIPLEQHERYIAEASHRYRVYWEALQLSGVTQSKNRIIAMYLDGSQHHIRQAVALHLTSLDKGQVTQPWQGEGALLDNGHGKLEPFVLTAGRRRQHTLQFVDGLDLLPEAEFQNITVASLEPAVQPTPMSRLAVNGTLSPVETPA